MIQDDVDIGKRASNAYIGKAMAASRIYLQNLMDFLIVLFTFLTVYQLSVSVYTNRWEIQIHVGIVYDKT